ncbi:MAG: hypothetical protein AAF196_01915 [Planctomycetota bacterium]
MTNPPQRISFVPANPVEDDDLKICYDFDGAPITQTKLCVTTKPPTELKEHLVSTTSNCVTIHVPAGAHSILVEDKLGDSADKSSSVERGQEGPME